jgi:hypothetical protein
MRKFVVVIFFLLASFTTLYAQLDNIAGTWICQDVSFLDQEEYSNAPNKSNVLEQTRKGFLGSKFEFKKDNLFYLQLATDMAGMAKELKYLNGKKWFYYPDKNQIWIGALKENLMRIDIEQKDDSVYFLLYETPIVLKMKKI